LVYVFDTSTTRPETSFVFVFKLFFFYLLKFKYYTVRFCYLLVCLLCHVVSEIVDGVCLFVFWFAIVAKEFGKMLTLISWGIHWI